MKYYIYLSMMGLCLLSLPGCFWNLSNIEYRTPAVYGNTMYVTEYSAPQVYLRALSDQEQTSFFGSSYVGHDLTIFEAIIKNPTKNTYHLLGSATGLPLESAESAAKVGKYRTLRFCVLSGIVGVAYFFPWLFAAVPMAIGMSSFNKELEDHMERVIFGPDDLLVIRPGQVMVRYLFVHTSALHPRMSARFRFWDKDLSTHVLVEVPITCTALT